MTSPGTGESLGQVTEGNAADAEAAIAAAKSAFRDWRRVPPFERAKMLRAIAQVLRQNGEELAMIDAADCGNPYSEMVRDAQMGAAQLDFYAGLVTEMKGASIPMGPDVVNFSVREPLWRGRPHHPVQPSLHVRGRQVRRRRSPPATRSCSSRPSRRRCRRCGWRS